MASSRKPLSGLAVLALASVLAGDTAPAQDLERGEALFGFCSQCHGETGAGDPMALAPAIAGLEDWYVTNQLRNFKSGVRGTHPDDVGGLRMHPMALWLKDDADVQAVAAYVASLPPAHPQPRVEGGNAARGATAYALCAACHGADGSGNHALNAPPLLETSDWYLLSSLEKYKAGVRGGNPQNPNALLMRGMAVQLVDEQAMKDVVAYIMTLRDAQ
jgi:cytochrome c553